MKIFIMGSTLALMLAVSPVLAQVINPAAPPPTYSRIIDSKGVVLSGSNYVRQIASGVWVAMQGAGFVDGLAAVSVPLLYKSENCTGTPYISYSSVLALPETLGETLISPGYLTGQIDGSGDNFIVGAATLIYAGRPARNLPRGSIRSENNLSVSGVHTPCSSISIGGPTTVGAATTIQLPIFRPPFMLSN